jgi:nucleoside-diphosphate-sugar epimerase
VKVAVTGANGFIGRHILATLLKQPVEVTALVRPSTTSQTTLPAVNIIHLDIENPPSNVYEYIGRPDVLIHLAWNGLNDFRSLLHYEHELPIHYRFLKGLIKAGLPSLVVSGTCLEYGMQSGPLHEDMETRPSTPYGFAKDTLRSQLQLLKHHNMFALTWTRLFYLYGKGQTATSLYPQLQRAVTRGDKIFNMSGGEQLRDYLPVDTAADILVKLALKKQDIGIVNACSGRPVAVRTLVEGWIKANNWPISLNLGHYPYPDYEPMAFWGDSHKLALYTRPE